MRGIERRRKLMDFFLLDGRRLVVKEKIHTNANVWMVDVTGEIIVQRLDSFLSL